MAIDNALLTVIPQLREWAEQKSFVRRLWVFGSRARGTQSHDSDLDVALEINPVGNDDTPLTSWVAESSNWKSEIQEITILSIDLQLYGTEAPKIVQYVSCCSILVYERRT